MTPGQVRVRALGRLCFVLTGVLCAGRVSVAWGQGAAAIIEVRVDSPRVGSAATDAPVPVRLQSVTDPSQSWSAQLRSGASVRFRRVPPGPSQTTMMRPRKW